MNAEKEREVTHRHFYDERYKRGTAFAGMLEVSKRIKFRRVRQDIDALVDRGEKVNDIGCGDGRLAALLARNFRVSGCDSARDTMSENRKRFPHIDFFAQDLTSDKISDNLRGSFRAATCIDVIEHLPFDLQPQLVENIADMLEPRGILILTTPDREVSLTFKRDSSISDEAFLREREAQPRADQLTSVQLDALLDSYFKTIRSDSLVPAIHSRILDLMWKALFLPLGYRGVEKLRRLLGVSGQYHYRVLQKR